MAGLDGCELQIRSYDAGRYQFRPALTRAAYEQYQPFDWEQDRPELLPDLHLHHAWLAHAAPQAGFDAAKLSTVNTRQTDQVARHYADLYGLAYHHLRPAFRLGYLAFMEEVVQPLFDEPVVYQTRPTLRVHMPGNVAVGEPHTDAKYGHPPEAVNFWVPATDAHASNSVCIKASDDTLLRPRDVKYGEYLVFDGVNLMHGNRINTTGKTRVSFDFRVVPISQFKPSDGKSVNTGLAFRTGFGGYYSLLTEDTLASERAEIARKSEPASAWETKNRMAWETVWAEEARRPLQIAKRFLKSVLS